MQDGIRTGGGPRVLVADDSEDALSAYEAYLMLHGYRVFLSATGDEALRQARETLPDAIILDHEMPGLTGCEVAEALASGQDTRDIPVIMLTGRLDRITRHRAISAGCVAFLTKPCDPPLLLQHLASALASREHRRPFRSE